MLARLVFETQRHIVRHLYTAKKGQKPKVPAKPFSVPKDVSRIVEISRKISTAQPDEPILHFFICVYYTLIRTFLPAIVMLTLQFTGININVVFNEILISECCQVFPTPKLAGYSPKKRLTEGISNLEHEDRLAFGILFDTYSLTAYPACWLTAEAEALMVGSCTDKNRYYTHQSIAARLTHYFPSHRFE